MNYNQKIISISIMTFAVIGAVIFFISGIYGFVQLAKNTGIKSEFSQFVAYINSITIKKEVINNDPKPEITSTNVTEFPEAPTSNIAKNQNNVLTPGQETTRIYPISNNSANSVVGKIGVDLAVNIIDVGIVTEPANTFTRVATMMSTSQRSGIVFEVSNLGSVASGMWYFYASLPVPGGDYNSDRQDSIPAGGKVRYTIGFQGLNNQGENKAVITVDPAQQLILDTNRTNNTATATLYRGY
jgi:hypothetical protein